MIKKKSKPKMRSIYINDQVWDELDDIAKDEYILRSELIRIWIDKCIKNYYKSKQMA